MDNRKNNKNFEFMKYFFNQPFKIGGYVVYQVGETKLEKQGLIHSHVQICNEITCVLSGRGTFSVNGNKHKISQGDIHLVSKGDIHEIKTDSSDGIHFAYLGFDFEDYDDVIHNLKSFYDRCPKNVVADKGEISTFFRMLIKEWYEEPENHLMVISSILNCLLTYVKRLFEDGNEYVFLSKKADPVVGGNAYTILHYIDTNVINISNLKTIAEKFGYTENYVSHLFKSKTGMSIKKYIMSEKMKLAADILVNTGCTITEVAERLGYSSSQSFSRMFRANMGCSPSEFRQKSLKTTALQYN